MVNRFNVPRHDMVPPQEAKGIGLRDLFSILRRRMWLILLIILAGTLLSLIATIELPKVYTARSTILLRPDDPNLLDTPPQPQAAQPNTSRMDTERDLMTSRVFAGRVIDELNLIADPNFNTYLKDRDDVAADRADAGPVARSLFWIADKIGGPGESDRAGRPALTSRDVQRDRAITVLIPKISVSRTGDSSAMTVAVSDDDPKMAASLANAVTSLYAEWSRDLKLDSTRNSIEFLRQQASELALRISTLENEIADYSSRENISGDPRDDLLRATMQQANEQLSVARGELARAQARLAQVRQDATGGGATGSAPLLVSDFLTTLRGEEATMLRERAQLARNYGANHPLIQEADAKIASARALKSEEMERIVASFEDDVRIAEDHVATIEQELAASEHELRERASAEIRLRELNRDLLTEQQLYDLVSARLGKLDPYAEVSRPDARVISFAAVPNSPSFPKAHTLLAGGFAGSLLLAFVAALGLESLDTRVRDAKRISQLLGAPVIGRIPVLPRKPRRRMSDLLELMRPRSALAEDFRSVYNACRRANVGSREQVIMISSGLPREGKTTTAAGLAIAAASTGARTVLVDLDLRTGGLCRSMSFHQTSASLENYLRGECGLHDVLQVVPDAPKLNVVMSSPSGDGAGILDPDHLERLVSALRSEYDIVVIDAPPLLVVEDAFLIAPFVDSVVLVTSWGRTTEAALSETSERLLLNGVPFVGIVLNRVNPSLGGSSAFRGSWANRRQFKRYFTKAL